LNLTTSEWLIEPASTDDLTDFIKIEIDAHILPWSEKMLQQSLEGEHLCWKLTLNNDLMGYMFVMRVIDQMELLNIVIAKNRQGKGYGGALLQHLDFFAKQHQLKSTFLEVRESNSNAIHLYQKYGFEQVGLRKNYYASPNGREDAILMQLTH